MSDKLGSEGKLFIAQTYAGSYAEMTKVTDVDLDVETTEVDKTTRAAQGWRERRGGLKAFSISSELVYDPTDTTWDTLRNAWLAGSQIGIKVLDGPLSGGHGFYGPARVQNWKKSEPLDGVMKVSFTIISDGKPDWI